MSRICRSFVDSRLSPARPTLLNKRRTTTYMNIYEPCDDPVTGDVVSTLSLVRTNWRQSCSRQLVAVDIVAIVEHVQFGRLCRI